MNVDMNVEVKPEDILLRVCDLCKHSISDETGKIPDAYVGFFDNVQYDLEQNPLINTINGILIYRKEDKNFIYSVNLISDPENIAIETNQIGKYLEANGINMLIGHCMFIDAAGTVYFANEARKHHALEVEHNTIMRIKKYQDEKGAGLILPEKKIVVQ